MSRFNVPTPTRGPGPSRSPTDVRYTPGGGLANALGWFSIGLGLAEVLAPKTMMRMTGVRSPALLQVFGLREIISGLAILSCARPAGPMWSRVAGDAMDLAALAGALNEADGEQRERTLASMAAVAGVTALDVASAMQLSAAAALEG